MTSFWKDNPQVLLENTWDFFPSNKMSRVEKLNAIVRLSIYSSIIACIYYRSPMPILLALFIAITSIFANEYKGKIEQFLGSLTRTFNNLSGTSLGNIRDYFRVDTKNLFLTTTDDKYAQFESREKSTGGSSCVAPTLSNPFMNPTLEESTVRDTPPCDINDPDIKEKTENYFTNNLFRDTSDLFGKISSQRQFYSIPNHDSISFAKWLYKNDETCKQNNDFCLKYEDIRANRRV